MSHFTTIETEFRDIDALRDACGELGLDLIDDADARGYAGRTIPADHVIKLNGPYDVAVTRSNERYDLVADFWQGHVERELGTGYSRLKQLYGVHKATREARRSGFHVRRQPQANGTIRLALTTI
jgi:hypothetical protein